MSGDEIPALPAPPTRIVQPGRLPLRRTVVTHPGARTPEASMVRAWLADEILANPAPPAHKTAG